MNVMRPRIDALEYAMHSMPQVEPETRHYFCEGMYARELIHNAGVTIVGKVHKQEHFFILTKGTLKVTIGEEMQTLTAPKVLVSKPGTKRALFAIEDCIYMTVHKTNKKNLEKIEKEVVENAPLALLNSQNKLKELT